jgi:hypothetical protein
MAGHLADIQKNITKIVHKDINYDMSLVPSAPWINNGGL